MYISRASTSLRIEHHLFLTHRRQRGYAFVQYKTQEDMDNAIRNIDNTTLFGCLVEAMRAKNNRKSADEMHYRHNQYILLLYNREI